MSVADNLPDIEARIERACRSVGRNRAEITLVAVSKTQSIQAIEQAYALGLRDFGESRLQEAIPKIEALPKDIRWHFIGTLQSNKARRIAELFQVIHTMQGETQLREIAKTGLRKEVLVEVNIAEEPKKAGIPVKILDLYLETLLQSKQVHFLGLMTIGPALDDPEQMRPYFREMRFLNERAGGEWLSMGMSHDFDVAIQEGATHIRVGTALFGERA